MIDTRFLSCIFKTLFIFFLNWNTHKVIRELESKFNIFPWFKNIATKRLRSWSQDTPMEPTMGET
jgi:hypothetical protein